MRKTKFIIIVLLGCMVAPQTADAQMGNAIAYGISNIFKIAKNKKKQKELEKVTKALKENQTTQFSNANSVSNNQNSNTVNASENQNSNAENVSENQNSNTPSASENQNSNAPSAPSNPNDEVTLVVSSDGKTKDEAVKTALRSAIEQAYGTFVSANTTILNDELVKDEIVTVTTGNVKKYEEIACNVSQEGKTYVTLKATVCISKLVSYAQSKGAKTEFAGSTFGMNMRLKELNKKNEEKALRNLVEQVIALYPSAFSYKLTIEEPKEIQTDEEGNLDRVTLFDRLEPPLKKASMYGLTGRYEDYYISGFDIAIEPNEQMNAIKNLIINTVRSLALTESELEEYKKHNIPYWESPLFASRYEDDGYISKLYNDNKLFYFRSNCSIPFVDMNLAIAKILHSFEITDNMGNVSRISEWEMYRYSSNDAFVSLYPTIGTTLLTPWAKFIKNCVLNYGYSDDKTERNMLSRFYIDNEIELFNDSKRNTTLLKYIFFIPKTEIYKYKGFTIKSVPANKTVFKDKFNIIEIIKNNEYDYRNYKKK